MSLTKSPPPQKVSPHRRILIMILILLLAVAAAIFLFTRLHRASGRTDPSETRMPAIKVVLSNGCGYENLAQDYASYIKDQNIEVVRLTSTSKPIYDVSVIVNRHGDDEDLRRLQAMTGIQRFTVATNPDFDAPFLIILGRDYEYFMK